MTVMAISRAGTFQYQHARVPPSRHSTVFPRAMFVRKSFFLLIPPFFSFVSFLLFATPRRQHGAAGRKKVQKNLPSSFGTSTSNAPSETALSLSLLGL
jgi:hypothetical protein